jgi:hypothetical protein
VSAVQDETLVAYTATLRGAFDPELLRQARHHDVLCLVLRELYRSMPYDAAITTVIEVNMNIANRAADLAYPPPKAEP